MIVRIISVIIGSYLIGSISSAYLITKLLKGIDIRKIGTGNSGAANVFYEVGHLPGILVGVLDILKGILPVWLALILNVPKVVIVIAAVSVVLGHNWSIFLRFQGGAGFAPILGIAFFLVPREVIITGLGSFTVSYLLNLIPACRRCLKKLSTGIALTLVSLPILVWLLKEPTYKIYLFIFLAVVLFLKRVKIIQQVLTKLKTE